MSSSSVAAIARCVLDLIYRWFEDLRAFVSGNAPAEADRHPALVRTKIIISRAVIEQAIAEIAANPRIEVGGKFVGLVRGSVDADAPDWRQQLADVTIEILGSIDSGPGASRSPVHHLSDTDYQYALFQALLRDFPELDYIGLWHSHHPNGLGELSQGDLATGTGVVNGGQHDRDFLLSSLAVDRRGLLGGRQFVFLRGHKNCYEIDPASITVLDEPTAVGAAITRERARLRSTRTRAGRQPAKRSSGPPAWTKAEAGRKAIAADRAWLERYPRVQPRITAGTLVWQGLITAGELDLKCSYAYGDAEPAVSAPRATAEWSESGARMELALNLPSRPDREAVFAGLIEAVSRSVAAIPELCSTAQPEWAAATPGEPHPAATWSSNPAGPAELVLDTQWLRIDFPDLSPVLRGQALVWTGTDDGLGLDISYGYPRDFPASGPTIRIRSLSGSCGFSAAADFPPLDVARRRTALIGCLRAIGSLAELDNAR
jgi:hypothetical protein